MENEQGKDLTSKKTLSEIIDLDDYEDSQEYVDLPEPKILDPELYNLVSTAKFVEPSDSVEKKVINFYRKKYRYRIVLYNLGVKFAQYKESLFGSKWGLGVALASVAALFILGGITYYQYASSNNASLTNEIAKEENEINQPQIKDISKTVRGSFVTDPRALTSIKKIHIEILGNSESFTDIETQVLSELHRNSAFTITEKTDADAVLRFSLNSTSNEIFARLVDKKNHIIWSVKKSVTDKSSLGIEIIAILTEDINESKK